MTKTNAMRLLDAAGIAYRTAEYEYNEADLSGQTCRPNKSVCRKSKCSRPL